MALSSKWVPVLLGSPETGMDYQIVTIVLKNGTRFEQAVVVGGVITQIRGHSDIPFSEDEIQTIFVTHDKWDFREHTAADRTKGSGH